LKSFEEGKELSVLSLQDALSHARGKNHSCFSDTSLSNIKIYCVLGDQFEMSIIAEVSLDGANHVTKQLISFLFSCFSF
jgi:hypothetical protein